FEKIKDLLTAGVESPALLVMEASNAVLEASRNKRIGREDADKAIGVMLKLLESNIKVHEEWDLVQSALRIDADHGLTAYDSVYLLRANNPNGSLGSSS